MHLVVHFVIVFHEMKHLYRTCCNDGKAIFQDCDFFQVLRQRRNNVFKCLF